MINCHFVWPAVHMPERGREIRLVPVALSSVISIREVYYLWPIISHYNLRSTRFVSSPLCSA